MLKCNDEAGDLNWASTVMHILYTNGFGYVWENQGTDNVNRFFMLLTQRLKDQYIQKWHEPICLSSNLISNVGFKNTFSHGPYFKCRNE